MTFQGQLTSGKKTEVGSENQGRKGLQVVIQNKQCLNQNSAW